MPSPGAVLAQPNLSPCQTAKLVTQLRSSADNTAADLVDSLVDSLLDLVMEKGNEVKAKKTTKKKKQARKVPELNWNSCLPAWSCSR